MKSIIIADDEVIERQLLRKQLLRGFGDKCDIRMAANGREVLELHKERAAKVLVLDIEMPGVTGLEAAEEIRKEDKSCSIIFLTAFDDFSYAKRAINIRAIEYLLKPCDEGELINAVEEAFRAEEYNKQMLTSSSSGGDLKGPAIRDDADDKDINKALRIVEEEYMEELSVSRMASALGYTEPYFCRIFKQYYGKSFISFLTEYRIKKAASMLETDDISISRVGSLVGYADANYFTKVFKRSMNLSPSEYRELHKN